MEVVAMPHAEALGPTARAFGFRTGTVNHKGGDEMSQNFRVVRSAGVVYPETCCHGGGGDDFGIDLEVVWEGTDPKQYHGGIGAFDEGCCAPSRWFEVQKPDGSWVEVKDPRSK